MELFINTRNLSAWLTGEKLLCTAKPLISEGTRPRGEQSMVRPVTPTVTVK